MQAFQDTIFWRSRPHCCAIAPACSQRTYRSPTQKGVYIVHPLPVNSLWHYHFIKLKRLIAQIEQRLGLHHVVTSAIASNAKL